MNAASASNAIEPPNRRTVPRRRSVSGEAQDSMLYPLPDVLLEERDRSLPRQLGRRRIVARRRVVVKSMLSARVKMALVFYRRRLERFLERRPARIDARIIFSGLDH